MVCHLRQCLRWSFLCLIWMLLTDADVYVRRTNETEAITYFLDLMADFGPEIPEHGITGFVHPVKPLNACAPVEPPPDNVSTWIALIARDNCTFADKVRNVQNWYKAAIIFNRKELNRLEKMHGDGNGIKIPSVFVGWSDGRLLQTDYCYFCTDLGTAVGNYVVTVDNKEYTYNPYLLWPFAVVVGTCFILMLVFMIPTNTIRVLNSLDPDPDVGPDLCPNCLQRLKEKVKTLQNYLYVVTVKQDYHFPTLWPFFLIMGVSFVIVINFAIFKWCRDLRKKRKSRLSAKHLKKIPTKKFKKGDDYDVCAICLDDYEEGDKIRLLPCSHVYHCACIDPWLTKSKRSCPICKRKVIPGDDPDSDESESDDEADTASERTPLLGGGQSGNNNNNRRSTFDNSGLPEASRPQRVHNVQETTETETDSDSEQGAVGGVPSAVGGAPGAVGGVSHAEIVCQPQASSSSALKTETVSETSDKAYKSGKRPVAKSKTVTKEIVSKKETVARDVAKEVAKKETVARQVAKEVARGEDNEALEDENDSSGSLDGSSEVYFNDPTKKDEKKTNHVV